MDINFGEAVATWLVADGRTLIAPECSLGIGENPALKDPVRWPDILAVRPKDKHIFLCEVTWGKDWRKFRDKIADYHDSLDNIRASLDHWLGVGDKEWRISVWYFVPKHPHVGKIRSMKPDNGIGLYVTSLETITPWKYTWGFRDAGTES